jgi:hypothetical protein
MLALAGVSLLLIAAETAREMANAEPAGASVVSNLGYAIAEAVSDAYIAAGVTLVMGGVVYLSSYLRSGRITFLKAICNWVVVAAAVSALLMYLE